jgi:membrane-anchored protein YejM (alkaline phosphatase superfamily)
VDIAPTLLRLLGVRNPVSDYSVGIDLLGPEPREYAVVCNWDCAVYVGSDFKAILPVRTERYIPQRVTTHDDVPVQDQDGFYASHKRQLQQIAQNLQEFSR